MIRKFTREDLADAVRIHEESGLDPACFPDVMIQTDPDKPPELNALFVVKGVKEVDGKPAMMGFLKIRSEAYVLVDHNIGTPEERWEWMKEIKNYLLIEGERRGLDQITAFIPPDIEESFGKRLEEMGFIRGKWTPYSLNID